jgi:DNA modification methylase
VHYEVTVEAINHQRYAMGLDIDSSYIDIAMKRIEKECCYLTD